MHLARTSDLPTFELLVFRGYAEFVFEALCEGAAEFGFRVEP
jgi:sarcosine oxidase gamma subunit